MTMALSAIQYGTRYGYTWSTPAIDDDHTIADGIKVIGRVIGIHDSDHHQGQGHIIYDT